MTGSDSRGLDFGHNPGGDLGRNYQRHECDPGSEVGLEGYLITIAPFEGLAGEIGDDLVRAGLWEKLFRSFEQSFHTLEPFAFSTIGLEIGQFGFHR